LPINKIATLKTANHLFMQFPNILQIHNEL
jgi:hypothetical protein